MWSKPVNNAMIDDVKMLTFEGMLNHALQDR
jgi:hypothetical protein